MLRAVPKRWFSWDFNLVDPSGASRGEVALSVWRERGSLRTEGPEYAVTRQGMTGPFLLKQGGREQASALKLGVFKQEFALTHDGDHYLLKRISAWRREFGLFKGATQVGSIVPESWFARAARIDLPEGLPLWFQAFIVWLTLLMWKRDSDAVGASS